MTKGRDCHDSGQSATFLIVCEFSCRSHRDWLDAVGPVRGTGRVAHAPIDGDGTSWEPPTRQAAVALPLAGAKRRMEPALEKAGPAAAAPAKCEQPANALDLGLVVVRDTGTIKGLGVFAAADLEAQTFFGEYTGEVLTAKEYARRYPRADAEYVLEVNDDYSIDAGDPLLSPGPVRYANHSRSVCQHPKPQTLCNLPPAPRAS